ncbi:hypothetical protein [Ruminococcus sp.]|uniref:hypothetical protein n=1 Tax=Ruminococcus sp. TaxID=41978 RepID=UPI0025EBB038|nr:hypothetical protein [Ruminococcus sp.]MBQ8965106.1 hypothetical protein [Ruminococcus sp.]
MADDKRIGRRKSMDALFGAGTDELSEEFFEEKIKEMGDAPKITKGMALKHQKLTEDPASLVESAENSRVVRDDKMSALFGNDDIVPDEAEFEEKVKALEDKQEAAPEKPMTEYEQWLEEGLKKDKGYGEKVSYEGETSQEHDSYKGSTNESYDKWQAETQELIRNLKARDARVKARDDNIHDALYLTTVVKGGSGISHTGDQVRFFEMIASLAWFLVSSLAVVGVFYGLGVRGNDLLIPFGLGSLIGAIVRYNGKEGYTLSEAFGHGSVEIAVLFSTVVSWIISLFANIGLPLVALIAGVFAVAGEYFKQKVLFCRSAKESRARTVPFAVFAIAAAVMIFIFDLVNELVFG